jgi:uncharacterized membrane protein
MNQSEKKKSHCCGPNRFSNSITLLLVLICGFSDLNDHIHESQESDMGRSERRKNEMRTKTKANAITLSDWIFRLRKGEM